MKVKKELNMLKSRAKITNTILIPNYIGHKMMIPFCLSTLNELPEEFINLVSSMLKNIKCTGKAFFTIHGKILKKGETHRRPGKHIDGNYEPNMASWKHGGWKVDENGYSIDTQQHKDAYNNVNGGIIIASNFESCHGWIGDYDGIIGIGGDCSKINVNNAPFILKRNTVYYGNNHFIHESLPLSDNVHRVMVRITLPMTHVYQIEN